MADGWDQGTGAAVSTHSTYTCVRLQFCLVTILLFYTLFYLQVFTHCFTKVSFC